MADSLQDQLVKAGLATKQEATKQQTRKKPPRKAASKATNKNASRRTPARKGQGGAGTKPKREKDGELSLAAAYSIRAKTEHKDEAISKKRKQMEDERRRKINLQLKELILPAAQNQADAEVERFLEYKGKIRKLYVTPSQQDAINAGQMGVVYLQGRHYIVELEIVRQVEAIQADNVSLLILSPADDPEAPKT